MATENQAFARFQGGGRIDRAHTAKLTIVAGQVGVTGAGAITGGAGYINGVYPLIVTGGVLASASSPIPAGGTFTVAGGAVSAISVTSPGAYSTAPTGFNFAAAAPLAGPTAAAAAVPTTAQVASMAYPVQNETTSLPPGAYVTTIRAFTVAALAGAPTNAYLMVGASYQGQDYVAQTDVKAQGEVLLTKVGSGLAALRGAGLQPATMIVATLLINGGGGVVSGQVECEIHYLPSNV